MHLSGGKSERGYARWTGAAMLWLAVCCATTCVALLGLLSVERLPSPVEIESAYPALVVGQAFFLVFLWPLFERPGRRGGEGAWGAAARLLGLFLLSAPLIVVALRTSETGLPAVIRSQLLVLLIGVTVAAVIRLPGSVSWYYPAAFLLSAVVPLAAYLLYEEGGVSTAWAAAISPFWASGSVAAGGGFMPPLAVFACLGCGALGALAFVRLGAARAVRPDQA
jgi:hypothetical protein